MSGAVIYDGVTAGVPEALEAIELARARIASLPEDDLDALLEEVTGDERNNATQDEILSLCMSEVTARRLRAAKARDQRPNEEE